MYQGVKIVSDKANKNQINKDHELQVDNRNYFSCHNGAVFDKVFY